VPPMPDRLDELVRQRALVQEHLAWLNREIAAAAEAAKAPAPSASPVPSIPLAPAPASVQATLPSVSPAPPPPPAAVAATPVDADEILARYQAKPGSVKQDVRKGCFLYFAAAFVLLGIGVALLYLVLSARR
jgi:hypothetical protein